MAVCYCLRWMFGQCLRKWFAMDKQVVEVGKNTTNIDVVSHIQETNLAQNLTSGRLRHGESESQVENLEIIQPELEIKENYPKISIL